MVDEYHCRASAQRHEQLEHREVEAQRGRGQHAGTLVIGPCLHGPPNEVHDLTMLDSDALRHTSGTGRVDHVCQPSPVIRRCDVVAGVGLTRRETVHHDRMRRPGGHTTGGDGIGQHHRASRICGDEAQAIIGIDRIQRHVGAARLQHRQHRDHEIQLIVSCRCRPESSGATPLAASRRASARTRPWSDA